MVLWQTLNIVGDTIVVMIIGLATNWAIMLPLAIFLPKWFNLGVYGIWWATVVVLVIRAVIYSVYFMIGRWVRKRI